MGAPREREDGDDAPRAAEQLLISPGAQLPTPRAPADMHAEATFILLFVVATSVAIASRKLNIPYSVALVVTGLTLGALDLFEAPALTQELLFAIFLPGLLFEAAYHLEARDFRRNLAPIVALAVPGVLVAIALTALILTPAAASLDFMVGFTWQDGLILGALLAATDPIAVIALFKSLGAPGGSACSWRVRAC